MLENNRNQLEAKGLQLASNKEQLQKYCQHVESRDHEIGCLKDTVRELETQLVAKVKTHLMEAERLYKSDHASNGETTRKVLYIL